MSTLNTNYQFPPADVQHINLEELREFQPSDEKITRVYIVRHGESVFNIPRNGIKYVQGKSPQADLTEKGQKQAAGLAELMAPRMKGLNARILASTAKRATDTAKPVLIQLNRKELPTYPEFLELGSGRWEGCSKADPAYKKEYKKWEDLSANGKFSAPKLSSGEAPTEVALRSLDKLSEIISDLKTDETVFLYSHSMLMNCVALSLTNTRLSEEPGTPFPEYDIENGGIFLFEFPKGSSIDQGQFKAIIHPNLT